MECKSVGRGANLNCLRKLRLGQTDRLSTAVKAMGVLEKREV